jgi:transcription termination factor NusA
LKSEYIELLKTAGIKTKENLADLSSDELSPILDLNEDEAGKIIMDARADWFN